jgi:hypothetical protein
MCSPNLNIGHNNKGFDIVGEYDHSSRLKLEVHKVRE